MRPAGLREETALCECERERVRQALPFAESSSGPNPGFSVSLFHSSSPMLQVFSTAGHPHDGHIFSVPAQDNDTVTIVTCSQVVLITNYRVRANPLYSFQSVFL